MIKNLKILLIVVSLTIPLSVSAFDWDDFVDEIIEKTNQAIENSQSIQSSQSSEVRNEIRVETNTGGNQAESGQVIEGQASSSVKIENIINGQSIDPVHIQATSSQVKIQSEIKVQDGRANVKREIEVGSQKDQQNYEIDLENGEPSDSVDEDFEGIENKLEPTLQIMEEKIEPGEKVKELTNSIRDFWQDFIGGLKSFFQNIFSIF